MEDVIWIQYNGPLNSSKGQFVSLTKLNLWGESEIIHNGKYSNGDKLQLAPMWWLIENLVLCCTGNHLKVNMSRTKKFVIDYSDSDIYTAVMKLWNMDSLYYTQQHKRSRLYLDLSNSIPEIWRWIVVRKVFYIHSPQKVSLQASIHIYWTKAAFFLGTNLETQSEHEDQDRLTQLSRWQ